jgi:hypothetical protein
MRCGQSLQKRCMPGVGRSKIQPGRPRIREVLGRSVAPVATQPDDKRAGGRVEGRNNAALIGRYLKTPTKVGHLNLHVSKFAMMSLSDIIQAWNWRWACGLVSTSSQI